MKTLFSFLFVSLLFSSNTIGQSNGEIPTTDLAKAFGYCFGVELSLDKIRENYPDLQREALYYEGKFKEYHGKAFAVARIGVLKNLYIINSNK